MRTATRLVLLTSLGLVLIVSDARPATAIGNEWSPVIVARGAYRHHLKSMPITSRPNRPFHVYGNTVRRIHALSHSKLWLLIRRQQRPGQRLRW